MTRLELVESELAMLSRRLLRLEQLLQCVEDNELDRKVAGAMAAQLGVPPETLLNLGPVAAQGKLEARRRLALELKRNGWSLCRIARVFNCWERSAARWLHGSGCPDKAAAKHRKKRT